ncbi:4Fe-4S binding protein [Candidatus Micrarchaeota archaeon]|nr:4Fe-4S binding protein [Candidatus Micrarchaeota archaeon]
MTNTEWIDKECKRCMICVLMCPKKCLNYEDDKIIETEGCIKCKLCEEYCPHFAIFVKTGNKVAGK